jgi:hypothetical protein
MLNVIMLSVVALFEGFFESANGSLVSDASTLVYVCGYVILPVFRCGKGTFR